MHIFPDHEYAGWGQRPDFEPDAEPLPRRVFRYGMWATLLFLVAFAACAFAADAGKIVVNADAAGKANRVELLTVTDRYNLPAGRVAVDIAPVLTKANSGLFLSGNGSTLHNAGNASDWIQSEALAIRAGSDGLAVLSFFEPLASRPAVMPAGQVGWLFAPGGTDGTQFYPAPATRFLPGQQVTVDPARSFMRAYKACWFLGYGPVVMVPKGHGLKVGDDVFATDGPAINEVVPEYRTVKALGPYGDAVLLDRALTRQYKQGTLVAGPFPKSMTFQGTRFRASGWGPVLVQQALDIKFNDCTFDQAFGWVQAIGSSRLSFVNCTMPSGFASSTSHDIKFRNCSLREVQCEQMVYDLSFDGCRIGPGPFDSKIQCTGWTLKDCITTAGLFIYDDWQVSDHVAYGPVTVRGRSAVVRNLWSAQTVQVQAVYQGGPPGAATEVTLDSIVAPSIHLWPGSSGTIRNRTCPVTGSTENWKITPKQ